MLRNEKHVIDCLERARKTAKALIDSSIKSSLYVTMLNEFLYFFSAGVETITADVVNKFAGEVSKILDEDATPETQAYFQQTLAAAKRKQKASGSSA